MRLEHSFLKKIVPKSIASRIGMIIFFTGVVPLCVFGIFFLYSFTHTILSALENTIVSLEREQRDRMVKIMEETVKKYVRDRVIDVARQLDLYIKNHPSKTLSDLRVDPEFRKFAVQPVGKSGYTAVQTTEKPIRCVIHRNRKIEMMVLKRFSQKYPGFYKIIKASLNGKYSCGFYRWYDERQEKEIKKFMYIAPLMERTADSVPLSVAATISMDEFTAPLKNVERVSQRVKFSLINGVKKSFWDYRLKGVVVVFLVFMFVVIITLYCGKFFSKQIQKIKDAFKEINKGNFNMELEPVTGGEIKEITEEFNKMVKSLKETTVKKELLTKTKKNLEKLNLELNKYIKKLEKSEREKSQFIKDLKGKTDELEAFIYLISHDLRSPLITIKGFLYFLEEDCIKGNHDKVKQDIEYIKKACDSMDFLLKDLLEFSRIGRRKEKFEMVSLSKVVDEVLFLLSGLIKEKGVKVEVKSSLPKVYGDRNRLKEVFQNLIENAVKYMGDQKDPKIEIGTEEREGKRLVYVKDNGVGISSEHHEKIFNLFERMDTSSEGTGVGLAIVKKIVKLHDGEVWVESEKGKGSTFYVYIPQKKEM